MINYTFESMFPKSNDQSLSSSRSSLEVQPYYPIVNTSPPTENGDQNKSSDPPSSATKSGHTNLTYSTPPTSPMPLDRNSGQLIQMDSPVEQALNASIHPSATPTTTIRFDEKNGQFTLDLIDLSPAKMMITDDGHLSPRGEHLPAVSSYKNGDVIASPRFVDRSTSLACSLKEAQQIACSNKIKGILLAVLSALFFSLTTVIVKMVDDVEPSKMALFRFLGTVTGSI